MIRVIQSDQYRDNKPLLDKMFRLRCINFEQQIEHDGILIEYIGCDKFDDLNPVYILSLDGNMDILGSVRLIPTTGIHMLADVYHSLHPDEKISSPLIWESSKFIVNHKRIFADEMSVKSVIFELLTGIISVALQAGLDFVIALFDARMNQWFDEIGFKTDIIAGPKLIGKTTVFAALLDIDHELIREIEELQAPFNNNRYAAGGKL